jgi:hypothetical protein
LSDVGSGVGAIVGAVVLLLDGDAVGGSGILNLLNTSSQVVGVPLGAGENDGMIEVLGTEEGEIDGIPEIVGAGEGEIDGMSVVGLAVSSPAAISASDISSSN